MIKTILNKFKMNDEFLNFAKLVFSITRHSADNLHLLTDDLFVKNDSFNCYTFNCVNRQMLKSIQTIKLIIINRSPLLHHPVQLEIHLTSSVL